jgi:hypothetical protein
MITENKNSGKVNKKVFLMIKSGQGFMGSLMHSLIKDMVDIGSYNLYLIIKGARVPWFGSSVKLIRT